MSDLEKHGSNDFRQYYEANVPSLVSFARRFVPESFAQDIVHDVFLEIWEKVPVAEKLPACSYLFTAVRNRCINAIRKEQVQENYVNTLQEDIRLMGLEYYDSIEKLLIDKEKIQELHKEIESLPDKCRQVFKLAYFEEKRNAEIAEFLNLSIRTVEHQLYLGLRTLREKIKKEKKNGRKFFIFF